MRHSLALLVLVALPLAGCGHAPATAVKPRVTKPAAVAQAPAPVLATKVAEQHLVAAPATTVAGAEALAAAEQKALETKASVVTDAGGEAPVADAAPVANAAPAPDAKADFVRFIALQQATLALAGDKPISFHVSAAVQGRTNFTAEIDVKASTSLCELSVTDSNWPGAKGSTIAIDPAHPLAGVSSKLDALSPDTLAALSPALPLVSPASLVKLLAEASSHVQAETTATRNGHDVVTFSIDGGAMGPLTVGFPAAGGMVSSIDAPKGGAHLELSPL